MINFNLVFDTDFFLYCSRLEYEEDEPISKPSNLSYWTPQTHRKSAQNPHFYQRNSRRRSTDRYQRKSEIFSAHKQNQYYSPQVTRRKSEFHYFQESSDSEVEETPEPILQPIQQPKARLPYYGGVKPVYLPNSRAKAQKMQQLKTPLYANPSSSGVPVNAGCQGCCHHHHHNKKTNEDKRCIIS